AAPRSDSRLAAGRTRLAHGALRSVVAGSIFRWLSPALVGSDRTRRRGIQQNLGEGRANIYSRRPATENSRQLPAAVFPGTSAEPRNRFCCRMGGPATCKQAFPQNFQPRNRGTHFFLDWEPGRLS